MNDKQTSESTENAWLGISVIDKREDPYVFVPPNIPMATTTYTQVPNWLGASAALPQTPELRQL